MWGWESCASASFLRLRMSWEAFKMTDARILPMTIKSISQRWEPGVWLFFLSPLKVILSGSQRWEPLRQVSRHPWKRQNQFLFPSSSLSKTVRQPKISPCPSARSLAQVQLLPLPHWAKGKCQARARNQTRLPGQEANRFVSVSAPREVKRSEENQKGN